jgi:hypothetical protein
MTPLKPIIYFLGPSGVGKSCNSKGLKEDYSFLHIEIQSGFKRNDFPAEWDEDVATIDFAILAADVRNRISADQRGAALSLRAEHVLTLQQLTNALRAGISPIVLWGTKERCFEARRVRQVKRLGQIGAGDVKRYWQMNTLTFATYGRAEYDAFRLETFQPDGSRWPREHLLKRVLARTNQPMTT